jgi:hypothetical protein
VGIHEQAHKGVEELAKKKKSIFSLEGELFFKLTLLFFKFIQSFSFFFVFFKRYKMEAHKSWQTKNTPKRANHKGNEKKSNT